MPVWCGARDREAAETGRVVLAPAFRRPRLNALVGATAGFEGAPVARTLAEGDALAAGFTVLDTPGHSPGHVSFWREADRTLICGDVFFNMHLLTTIPGLRQPPAAVHDRPGARTGGRSAGSPRSSRPTPASGTGPVLRGDAAQQLRDFVQTLPPS